MRHLIIALVALATVSTRALAQNEATLRAAFEGKTLTVKIDMPATSKGIDVFPEASMPVNWREMAVRMKDHGTALRTGQTTMITKVIVKKDSHIEFQLGGGGYGTFGDYMSNSSSVSANTESESKWERQLRDSINNAPGPTKRKQFERELSNARSARERENSRAQAEAAQANEAREANLRAKRAESGSRFNIRYRNGIPSEALTPEGIMRSLAQYAEFSGGTMPAAMGKGASTGAATPSGDAGAGANALLSLKKGLTLTEVEALLGPANTASEVKEGSMTVMKRNYLYDGKKVVASFVSGVLIDYSIAPQ
ncbi:MAG: hypothetical protein Q8K82_22725 [Gemmatimonadaceae bacterium]|nr:hypothetical protein [Gemmatimonadaceae bacterium]